MKDLGNKDGFESLPQLAVGGGPLFGVGVTVGKAIRKADEDKCKRSRNKTEKCKHSERCLEGGAGSWVEEEVASKQGESVNDAHTSLKASRITFHITKRRNCKVLLEVLKLECQEKRQSKSSSRIEP